MLYENPHKLFLFNIGKLIIKSVKVLQNVVHALWGRLSCWALNTLLKHLNAVVHAFYFHIKIIESFFHVKCNNANYTEGALSSVSTDGDTYSFAVKGEPMAMQKEFDIDVGWQYGKNAEFEQFVDIFAELIEKYGERF